MIEGGGYSSDEFIQFLEEEGTQTKRGRTHCPLAKSVLERFFRTLMGRIRKQLLQSGLPSFLWGGLDVYCSPTRALQMNLPIVEFTKHIIGHLHLFNFSRLHPFGCLTFAHQQQRSSKLQPTSKRMIFVGLERGALQLVYGTLECLVS